MLNIEFKEREGKKFSILVNGKTDKGTYVYNYSPDNEFQYAYSAGISSLLLDFSCSDLEKVFCYIEIEREICTGARNANPGLSKVEVAFSKVVKRKGVLYRKVDRKVRFIIAPDWEEWAKPYSIAEYAEALKDTIKSYKTSKMKFYMADTLVSNGFGLECRIASSEKIVRDQIEAFMISFEEVIQKAEDVLWLKSRERSVTAIFRFPPGVKNACEQYLVYFTQFLEDLGINAVAKIEENACDVLFSVTPVDQSQALNKIREALDIYLSLPSEPRFGSHISAHQDVAAHQLNANVMHLQSQLALARAIDQTKDATIEMLRIANYQLRHSTSTEERECEALIGDTVHVEKISGKGFQVNLPLVLRRLKRVLGIK